MGWPDIHVFAGLGYASFGPNSRGSDSYGDGLLTALMSDVGGGEYDDVMTGVDYDSLGELPADGWLPDADGAPALAQSSWYTYTGADSNPPHAILSNPGVVLAVRTGDGRFAKVQIMSYYKGGAAIPTGAEGEASRFYTFRFVFQSDGSRKVN